MNVIVAAGKLILDDIQHKNIQIIFKIDILDIF